MKKFIGNGLTSYTAKVEINGFLLPTMYCFIFFRKQNNVLLLATGLEEYVN